MRYVVTNINELKNKLQDVTEKCLLHFHNIDQSIEDMRAITRSRVLKYE